mgnify:CR=1 FL=1
MSSSRRSKNFFFSCKSLKRLHRLCNSQCQSCHGHHIAERFEQYLQVLTVHHRRLQFDTLPCCRPPQSNVSGTIINCAFAPDKWLIYHFCHNNDQFCQRPCFRKNLWYIDIEISISVSTISKPGRISMKFSPLELLLVISIAVIVGIVLVVLVKYLIRYAIKFLRKN